VEVEVQGGSRTCRVVFEANHATLRRAVRVRCHSVIFQPMSLGPAEQRLSWCSTRMFRDDAQRRGRVCSRQEGRQGFGGLARARISIRAAQVDPKSLSLKLS
jgi:hypothetical protein